MNHNSSANHWLGMGVIVICPKLHVSFDNYFSDNQQQPPKEWKVFLLQDKSKRIYTILEVNIRGDYNEKEDDEVDYLVLHPYVAECLLYLESILPPADDIVDSNNTQNDGNAFVNCIPFYISTPSPAVTMIPLTSTTTATTTDKNNNSINNDVLWYAKEIKTVYYPHPTLFNNATFYNSSLDTNHYYSTKLCITLCYSIDVFNLNHSISTKTTIIHYLKQALVHRLITKGMVLLLPIPYSCWEQKVNTNRKENNSSIPLPLQQQEESSPLLDDDDEILHLIVHNVGPEEKEEAEAEEPKKCYRVGPVESFQLTLLPIERLDEENEMRDREQTKSIIKQQSREQEEGDTYADDDDILCPGYTSLLLDLVQLATLPLGKDSSNPQVKLSSTSPILLTGCSGVGKTRLASSLIQTITSSSYKYQLSTPLQSHVVSMRDLLMIYNSYTSSTHHKDVLLDYIVPPSLLQNVRDSSSSWFILILDDIDLIVGPEQSNDDYYEESEDASNSMYALIGNSLSKAIKLLQKSIDDDSDRSRRHRFKESSSPPPFILGISRLSLSQLPRELRLFEKEIVMPPPNQAQREAILKFWLKQLPVDGDNTNSGHDSNTTTYSASVVVQRWAKALSSPLLGCVASDLRRLCADALITATSRCTSSGYGEINANKNNHGVAPVLPSCSTKVLWSDIREAVRNCIPSPLVALDVTPPCISLGGDNDVDSLQNVIDSEESFRRRHEQCWTNFGGYSDMKDRLYRTVIGPWRRYLSGGGCGMMGITPPTGVVFHGQSGIGKTLAAECLASSLGLNIIKVNKTRKSHYFCYRSSISFISYSYYVRIFKNFFHRFEHRMY